jgi:hypothetical protein
MEHSLLHSKAKLCLDLIASDANFVVYDAVRKAVLGTSAYPRSRTVYSEEGYIAGRASVRRSLDWRTNIIRSAYSPRADVLDLGAIRGFIIVTLVVGFGLGEMHWRKCEEEYKKPEATEKES